MKLRTPAIVIIVLTSLLSVPAYGAGEPCESDDGICWQKKYIDVIYQNEYLKRKEEALERSVNSAEDVAAANGRRADKAEKELQKDHSPFRWFLVGALATVGVLFIVDRL